MKSAMLAAYQHKHCVFSIFDPTMLYYRSFFLRYVSFNLVLCGCLHRFISILFCLYSVLYYILGMRINSTLTVEEYFLIFTSYAI